MNRRELFIGLGAAAAAAPAAAALARPVVASYVRGETHPGDLVVITATNPLGLNLGDLRRMRITSSSGVTFEFMGKVTQLGPGKLVELRLAGDRQLADWW